MPALTLEQITALFDELKLPRALAAKGSPVDIVCPNAASHSDNGRDARTIARLYFDVCPHVHCFHNHCREANQELNTWLRLKVLGSTEFPDDFEGQLPEAGRRKAPADYAFARAVANMRARLLKKFRPRAAALEPSQVTAADFLRRLRVFKPDDCIWVGRENSSGQSAYTANFRTLEQWKAAPPPPAWPFTTGVAYLPGSFRRANANIKAVRALILESDELSVPETFALARWVEDEFSLPLLAAVSSGNTSLHCYFRYPGQGWVDTYGPALIAAGFDPRTFRPTQPIRLAGQTRADNGAVQSLLWARWLVKPRRNSTKKNA